MTTTHAIIIRPDGTLAFIYDDALRVFFDAGVTSVRRASHVEPTQAGEWTADMGPLNGPVLGPFKTRREALDAERRWLDEALR